MLIAFLFPPFKQRERNATKADFNKKSVSRVFLSLCFKQERGIAVGVTCGVGVFFQRANVFARESTMTAVEHKQAAFARPKYACTACQAHCHCIIV